MNDTTASRQHDQDAQQSRFMAFVLLSEDRPVEPSALIDQLQSKYKFPFKLVEGNSAPSEGEAFLLEFDGQLFSVLYINNKVPPGTMDEAISKARLWPQAQAAVDAHKTHYIVANLNAGAELAEQRSAAAFLTFICAALSDLTPASAINWTNAQTLLPAQSAVSGSKGLQENGEWPTPLWVNSILFGEPPVQRGTRKIGLITQGLRNFVGRELEFAPSTLEMQALLARSINLSGYLISNGPVLADGDTVGVSETERIRVEHTVVQSTQTPVYRLTLETANGA